MADYEAPRRWYERLLGRPPDLLPVEGEAVWRMAGTASIYVVEDEERAGNCYLTLAADDLEKQLTRLAQSEITATEATKAARERSAPPIRTEHNRLLRRPSLRARAAGARQVANDLGIPLGNRKHRSR